MRSSPAAPLHCTLPKARCRVFSWAYGFAVSGRLRKSGIFRARNRKRRLEEIPLIEVICCALGMCLLEPHNAVKRPETRMFKEKHR